MQNIVYEQQQQLLSVDEKQKKKINQFKKYLVDSGIIMHFVKFLLGLRNKQIADDYVPSTDPIAMFLDYFGKIQPQTTPEQHLLKQNIQSEKLINQQLKIQIQSIKSQIQQKKDEVKRKQEQKRLKEQQEAKNPKKGKK